MPTKTLGPWQGGLNLVSNRGLSVFLNDNELGDAENVVITDEGFLAPRPGMKVFRDTGNPGGLYEHLFQGVYSLVGSVPGPGGEVSAIVQCTNGSFSFLYKVRGEGLVTYLFSLPAGVKATSLIVHSGFTSAITGGAGSYTYPIDTGVLIFTNSATTPVVRTNLDLTGGPIYPDAATYKIPPSNYSVIVKDRLFLFDYYKNIMYWSPANYILDFRTDAATIAVAPFGIDTSGQEPIEPNIAEANINSVEFYNNNFYIFKHNSTFMFTYQLSPLTDGYMRKISSTMGAFDSCTFKDYIIVINRQGVFRLEGTEFIDLQPKMNFKFEVAFDRSVKPFIINFNNNILWGAVVVNPGQNVAYGIYYYYCMNLITGAWSRWSYSHVNSADPLDIPKPYSHFGSSGIPTICTTPSSYSPYPGYTRLLFIDVTGKSVLCMDINPNNLQTTSHLDSNIKSLTTYDRLYFPNVTIKTTASVGGSMLQYKKLYRYYTRFYLSEMPADPANGPIWTISINYNDYKFDSIKNPIFGLYPTDNMPPYPDPHVTNTTVNYFRAYQLVLPQQRAREFVFELKRKSTSMVGTDVLQNPDNDRPVKSGYYFLLSALWFDYQDKAKI